MSRRIRKKRGILPAQMETQRGFVSMEHEPLNIPDRTTPIQPILNPDGTAPVPSPPRKRGRPPKGTRFEENPPKNLYDIDPTKVQNLWERLPDENEREYAAFYIYLQLGPNRTLKAVAEKLNNDKPVDKVPSWLLAASYRRRWDERIIAYDRYMQRLEDEAVARVRKENAKRNAELLSNFETLIDREIKAFLKKAQKTPDDEPLLTPSQLTNMNEMLVSMRKLNEEYRKANDAAGARGQRKVIFQVVNVASKDIKKEESGNVVDADFTPIGGDDGSGNRENYEERSEENAGAN